MQVTVAFITRAVIQHCSQVAADQRESYVHSRSMLQEVAVLQSHLGAAFNTGEIAYSTVMNAVSPLSRQLSTQISTCNAWLLPEDSLFVLVFRIHHLWIRVALQSHLGATFDAGDNCLEHGHERCFAQSRRPRDDRQSVQRHRGGVRVQGGDCDERCDCAPSVAAADEGSAARHQRQHLRAHSNSNFKFKFGSNVEDRSAGNTGNLWTVGRGLVAFGRSLLETVHVQPLQHNDILTPNSYSCRFPATN